MKIDPDNPLKTIGKNNHLVWYQKRPKPSEFQNMNFDMFTHIYDINIAVQKSCSLTKKKGIGFRQKIFFSFYFKAKRTLTHDKTQEKKILLEEKCKNKIHKKCSKKVC